jgi:hypothetical protein
LRSSSRSPRARTRSRTASSAGDGTRPQMDHLRCRWHTRHDGRLPSACGSVHYLVCSTQDQRRTTHDASQELLRTETGAGRFMLTYSADGLRRGDQMHQPDCGNCCLGDTFEMWPGSAECGLACRLAVLLMAGSSLLSPRIWGHWLRVWPPRTSLAT